MACAAPRAPHGGGGKRHPVIQIAGDKPLDFLQLATSPPALTKQLRDSPQPFGGF